MKKLLVSILIISAFYAHPMDIPSVHVTLTPESTRPSELDKLKTKFSPPQEIKACLESNDKFVQTLERGVSKISCGNLVIYKKDGIDRFVNAQRLQACINRYNCNHLTVARKYVIQEADGSFKTIAEHVPHADERYEPPLTLQEIAEITLLAEKTGYVDIHSGNIKKALDGKLVIVDTEDRSFTLGAQTLNKAMMMTMLTFVLDRPLTPEAFAWLLQRKDFWKSAPGTLSKRYISLLPNSKEFDPKDIDFEKVRTEYTSIQKQGK